jgi:two-component system OmpR family sensor kinase
VTLRSRLLIVIAILMLAYGVTAALVVNAQRDLLIEQIDERLIGMPLLFGQAGPGQVGGSISRPEPSVDTFSMVYVAAVDADLQAHPLVVGSTLTKPPDVIDAVVSRDGEAGLVTISGVDSGESFRALVSSAQPNGDVIVATMPLNEVDDAINRLKRTLLIGGVAILAVLGALYIWIQRLGLKPIERVTAAAEAVAAGDRSSRVTVEHRETEAGKLGTSFNVMLDELDLADARLRQFVADASHELRTPLTSIRGYLDLYRQGAFRQPDELEDVVRRMSAESARMNDLVQDLFVLASLDEGRPLRYGTVDLGRLLRDVAQDVNAIQPGRPIEIETPADGPMLCGDEALLTQLIGILVANARTYTPADVLIGLSASLRGDRVVMTVSDRGRGLDADAASHVFDRFWRGEFSRHRKEPSSGAGSGLGLSIARSIVESHGGSIALDTAPGEGCTFTIELPVQMDRC